MGKILADAVALFEHLLERRRDHRRLRIVFELVADAVHQIDGAGQNSAACRKARRGIGGDRLQHRHQRTGKDVADRRRGTEAGGFESQVADALPRRARRGAAGRLARYRHPRSGIDPQMTMRGLDQHALGVGAEEIPPDRPLRRTRPDIDGVGDQLLAVAALRLQPQRAARKAHRALVTIGRDMTDVVDHARPVSFSGRLALGPCGK